MLKMWDKKGVEKFKLSTLRNFNGYRLASKIERRKMRYIMNLNLNKLNFFRKPTVSEQICNAGKSTAKAVGTVVVGTLYCIGAGVVAMGEAAAAAEARKAEARKEAREARKEADAAERRAREAEARAYGSASPANEYAYEIRRTRCTSCNGYIYEIVRRYEGLCRYSITVRKYSNDRVVRIEDTYSLSASIDVEKRFLDEIRRGHLD